MFTFADMEAKALLCNSIKAINLIAGLKSSTMLYIFEYTTLHEVNKSFTIEIVSSDIGYTEARTGKPITDTTRQSLVKRFSDTRFCFKQFFQHRDDIDVEDVYVKALESFLITQVPKLPIKP